MTLLGLGNLLALVTSHSLIFVFFFSQSLKLLWLQSRISKQETEILGKSHSLPIVAPSCYHYANISYYLEAWPMNMATVKTHFG